MKHFVVIAQDPTVLQQNAIMSHVIEGKYAYWHWISNTWLLKDPNFYPQDSAGTLRDKIKAAAPGLIFIAFEVQPTDWGAFSDPKWAEWLEEHWKQH
jgi:hypothetical protein